MSSRLAVLVILFILQFLCLMIEAQESGFNESQNTITGQYEALRQLYLSTRMYSESSMVLHNWNFENSTSTGEYCYFTGVTCDRSFMVTSIELNNTELSGHLPDTLSSFSSLRRLRLYNNSIEGSIPVNLLQIPTLQLLNLGQNLISGTLPEFATSKLFTRITLRRNAISGTIPYSLCNLTNLVVLELSQLTRMRGRIPDCLGTLTSLTALRLSDIGLTGTVPKDLCSVRLMNGLTPNIFGCDAIACPVGTFQRSVGRQTNENTPCTPCNVPSNVIGTTTCQWHEIGKSSSSPSGKPTVLPPTATPSIANPLSPVYHNENTDAPSVADDKNLQPLSVPFSSASPVTRIPKPTIVPTSFPTVIDIQSSKNRLLAHPGYISVVVLLCILVPTVIVAVLVWQRRSLLPSHKRLADETSSYPGSSAKEVNAEMDFPLRYPSIVHIKVNIPESKEFDVGDDVSLNLNDVRFARYDGTIGDDGNPITGRDTKQKDTISYIVKKVPKKVALPIDKTFSPARKVRFHVPETKPASELSRDGDLLNNNQNASMGHDDWISWLLNPLFDPIAACGVPCRDITKSDVDISSAISLDSTYSNLSALFVAHGALNKVHPHWEHNKPPPVIPSLLDASSVLGIRDLNSMNDDSSLNSQDGSVVENAGSIFRQTQESRRRVRATWNSLQDSLGNRGFISAEGTVEI